MLHFLSKKKKERREYHLYLKEMIKKPKEKDTDKTKTKAEIRKKKKVTKLHF